MSSEETSLLLLKCGPPRKKRSRTERERKRGRQSTCLLLFSEFLSNINLASHTMVLPEGIKAARDTEAKETIEAVVAEEEAAVEADQTPREAPAELLLFNNNSRLSRRHFSHYQ
jgi:hypothetical protein